MTSDHIPTSNDSSPPPPSKSPLSEAPRSHPPPLYYLPAILTPAQATFLAQRKAEVKEAVEKEWELFKEERTTGVKEIDRLRKKVAQEFERKRIEAETEGDKGISAVESADAGKPKHNDGQKDDASMEVDDNTPVPEPAAKGVSEKKTVPSPEAKEESTAAMQADDDDAVEY